MAHLKAETRTNTLCVRELLNVDDMALVATDYNDIQEIVNSISLSCNHVCSENQHQKKN